MSSCQLYLAAALPLTEVVGKGDYFRFGMRDSLAIEASFLQREEELLSNWWREYGECSIGPKGSLPSISESDPVSYVLATTNNKLYSDEEERVGVPVKGGLYEVDLLRRHSFPVYWNGDNRRVLRGHWFARKGTLDWFPLREDVAEQLEFAYRSRVWHRRTFQPSGLFAARVDMQGSSPGLHAIFTGEDDTRDAWLNIPSSGFSGIVHFGGTGIKLRRGYAPSHSPKPTQDELRQKKEEEMCSQVPVGHLVFMVHGIGQRLQKANSVDDVGTFRQLTQNLAMYYQRETQRVLFIPCQVRIMTLLCCIIHQLFDDLLTDNEPVAPYIVNGQLFQRGYYLTDGIYPQWSCFVKSFSQSRDDKIAAFKRRQESARKDVERAFGVLQGRWRIIAQPARAWTVNKLRRVMYTCIILHNMILKNQGYAISEAVEMYIPPGNHMLRSWVERCAIRRRKQRELRDRDVHSRLQRNLIEHVWTQDQP